MVHITPSSFVMQRNAMCSIFHVFSQYWMHSTHVRQLQALYDVAAPRICGHHHTLDAGRHARYSQYQVM